MGIDTGLDSLLEPNPGPYRRMLERETGIEPVSLAWKAKVLPLNYSRLARLPRTCITVRSLLPNCFAVVEEAGFEPA
jgi:hypothetical protein